MSNTGLVQCEDCGHHFQISPRGEIQLGACPDCGGKRMFRMQPNPVQSEGTLRNMVDMETGKDAGGNPDGEGILAPPSGRAILTAFIGDELECPTCHMRTGDIHCPRCGTFIDPTGIASEHSGVPAELRPQIPGAPLTEGTIMGTEHTDPYDTGAHGRDEYTHGHVVAALVTSTPDEGYNGWTNWDTWHTKLMMDNEQHLYEEQQRMAEEGWTPEQIRDWAIHHVIGPHNAQQLQDAQEWNAIPHEERRDPHFEELKNKSPQAADIVDSLGFGPDVEDTQAHLMDPELVNWNEIHHNIMSDHEENQRYERGEEPSWQHPVAPVDNQPGDTTFPEHWNAHTLAEVAAPMSPLKCVNCGHPVTGDPGMKELYCPNCGSGWPIHREMSEQQELHPADTIHDLYETPDIPTGQWTQQIPKRQGRTAGGMEDILGIDTPAPRTNLNWTPGMKGRGLVIANEPHTWNTGDPEKLKSVNDPASIVALTTPNHSEYVEHLGIKPEHVNWDSGIEINPDGGVVTVGGHEVAPFIAADPRLKHVEDKFFSFSSAMPTLARTNNMEPYESLWTHEADVMFDQGPLQNTPDPSPEYSVTVQPSEAGIHGAHTGSRGVLSFLDAHVNGIPVRGHGGELIAKYGFRKSPDFGKPVVVAVHDPAHLPVAVESLQHPGGVSTSIGNLAPRIQSGEVAAPPGIDAPTLQPLPDAFPDTSRDHRSPDVFVDNRKDKNMFGPTPVVARTASFWSTLGEAALPIAGLALAPETGGASLALDAGEAGALLGGEAAGAAGAGAAEGAAAEGASNTAGGLMSKAMSGAGGVAKAEGVSSLVNQGLSAGEGMLGMGQGGGGGQGGGSYSGPLQQFTHVLAAFVESDYETPASNPDVGVKHDDPEDVDQKEFNDQDKNPSNPMNPNLQDSGASGEDEVRKDMGKPTQGTFSPESAAIGRMEMLMPLVEKYYHSDESGANDPMLKGLHEMLEAENPGYLSRADEQAAERFMQNRKKPEHVHATVHESILPPMQQGNLMAQQQALDPTGLNPSQQPQAPSSQVPPGGGAQQGHCPHCGGVTQADGSCPQCGAAGPQSATPLPGGPSQAATPQTFAHMDLLASLVDSANHQGPVTPEQVAAVQQYLIQQGRVDEVPNVPLDPGNPEYAKILDEIQKNPDTAPTVTPEEQTQPPAPQPQAPGGMPVPGMAPGETGGQPMQPMSSFLPDFTAADNIAPRCPECGSATTGLVGDQDHHARCHSCKHVWQLGNLIADDNYGQSTISKVALRDEHQHGGQNEQANPIGVPAAQQSEQTNQGGDEDSSLTWKDTSGAPLKSGQTYQMVNPSFTLPDLIRVERVKPDGIDVTLLGTYANDPGQQNPNMLTSSTPISKEDAELQQLTFEPVDQTADDRNNEPPPGSQAPGYAQVPPSGQTTDEIDAQQPDMSAHSSVAHDPDCPRCGQREFTSSMISPEAIEHNCFRCGHDWVTEEKPMEHAGGVDLEWLNEDDDAEDLSPRRMGMTHAQAAQSRSISSIAEKDSRLRAVKDRLNHEKMERQERIAGRRFTPREQRELIDEDGYARNSDMLDLDGTHYKSAKEQERVNADNAPDSHLFLGI